MVVIGATNRPALIDPALLRPGRFDELVYVGTPDKAGRALILGIHARDMPLATEIGRRYAERVETIDDARGSAAYRRRVTAVEVRRAIEALAA